MIRTVIFMGLILICVAGMGFSQEVEHKVILITGASRGIGLATAETLAKRGDRVYAIVRQSLKSSHPNIHFEKVDLKQPTQIEKIVKKIIQKEKKIDVLVNNAGYALGGPIEHLTIDEIQAQMDVNFLAVIRMCQCVLPQMRKQNRGQIINISSEQGSYGLPYGAIYTASKAAVESLSEALSIELIPWNIGVSIIEPGLVQTNFTIKLGSRRVENSPYQNILTTIDASLKERSKHPELLEPSQTPEEVAEFLVTVIDDPSPKLRYQTSDAAKEMVSMKLKDLTGDTYFTQMKESWLKMYFPKQEMN